MATLLNFLGFQVVWFACVLGGARDNPWIGLAALGGFLFLHSRRLPRERFQADLRLGMLLAVVGWLFDSALAYFGVIGFDHGPRLGLLPLWMPALWVNMALTLRHSLGWIRGRFALASLLGAVAGALSYYAGVRLGALEFPGETQTALLALAAAWALGFPLALWCERKTA